MAFTPLWYHKMRGVPPPPCFVYLMESCELDSPEMCKIGVSHNPKQRAYNLSHVVGKMKVIFTFPLPNHVEARRVEKAAISHFQHKHWNMLVPGKKCDYFQDIAVKEFKAWLEGFLSA